MVPVEFSLNDVPRASQDEFFDYLNAALRRFPMSGATSALTELGSLEAEYKGYIDVGSERVETVWRVQRSADGRLTPLSLSAHDVSLETAAWKEAAHSFVRDVLLATLARKRARFFHQQVMTYCGPPLDGEYWFGRCRLAPVREADTRGVPGAEQVALIEQDVEAIDAVHSRALGFEAALRLGARLAVLLDVGLSTPDTTPRWIAYDSQDPTRVENRLCIPGFWSDQMTRTSMPAKGTVCSLGKYRDDFSTTRFSVGTAQTLKCPRLARRFFQFLAATDFATRQAFDHCARLYEVSLVAGMRYPTVRLAYQVAAVDALRAGVAPQRTLKEFVREQFEESDLLDTLVDHYYGAVRSAHFHAGEFPLGDFQNAMAGFGDATDLARMKHQYSGHRIMRGTILNWLASSSGIGHEIVM